MPELKTVERFIAMVETNKHDLAIEQFYTKDASMQENQTEPRLGRDSLVAREREVLSKASSVVSKCIYPFFINGDFVVIRWHFHFEWKDGTRNDIEEIAHQQWKDELIHREQFFYDPKQRIKVQ